MRKATHPTTEVGLLVSLDASDDRERPASEKSDASDEEERPGREKNDHQAAKRDLQVTIFASDDECLIASCQLRRIRRRDLPAAETYASDYSDLKRA